MKNCYLPLWTAVASKDTMSTIASLATAKKVTFIVYGYPVRFYTWSIALCRFRG